MPLKCKDQPGSLVGSTRHTARVTPDECLAATTGWQFHRHLPAVTNFGVTDDVRWKGVCYQRRQRGTFLRLSS